VTPVVMYMCSEQCQDTGVVINAGAGYFSRSAMMTGPGAILTDAAATVPTAEDIADNWAKITSLENPKYFFDANGIFPEMAAVLTGEAKLGLQK
jgi:hypothetical protein